MKRRSFLLLAGGASLFAPRASGLPRLLEPPQTQSNNRIGGAFCRGGPIRTVSVSVPSRTALPGSDIPKYVEPLPTFAGSRVSAANVTVSIEEFQQFVLPAGVYSGLTAPFGQGTYVWGYRVGNMPPHYPGFTIEAQRGTPTTVSYLNNLPLQPRLQQYLTIDQTLHWADPLKEMGSFSPYAGPPPIVTHLHGGEVPSEFDGNPESWFTPGQAKTGPGFTTNVYTYPNAQPATTLWFHDHALGITRIRTSITGVPRRAPNQCEPSLRLLQWRLRNRGSCPSKARADGIGDRAHEACGNRAAPLPHFRTAEGWPSILAIAGDRMF